MAKRKYDIDSILKAGEGADLSSSQRKSVPTSNVKGEEYLFLDVEQILDNPLQPRRMINKQELEELAKSIELHGLIHPISVVRVSDKKLVLLAGQRRLLAHKLLKKDKIPAIVKTDNRFEHLNELKLLDNASISKILFEISVSENESREPLSPLELALSIDHVLKDKVYQSIQEVADVLGKSKSYISKIYSTLKLCKLILDDLRQGNGVGHIEALYELQKIKDEKLQFTLYQKLKSGNININEIKKYSVKSKKEIKTYSIVHRRKKMNVVIQTKNLNSVEIKEIEREIKKIIEHYIS